MPWVVERACLAQLPLRVGAPLNRWAEVQAAVPSTHGFSTY